MPGEKFKVLEASGDPFTIGRTHGRLLRREIRDFIRYLHGEFAADDVTLEEARNFAGKFVAPIEEFSSEAYQEMRGIARGAEVKFEDIVMIALSEEIDSFSHACTTFAATGQATADGGTLLGQTWDDSRSWYENVNAFMLKKNYKSAPKVLAFIFPGLISAAGINPSCLGISWNTVPRLRLKEGVPTYVIISEVIKQKTVAGALAVVRRAERAGCFNFIVADASEIYNIEATPDDVDVDYTSSFYGHTNHYVGEKFSHRQDLEKEQIYSSASASTVMRHHRITNLLDDHYGRISASKARDFLQDHRNFPDSICSHPNPTRSKDHQNLTRAAWVMRPCCQEWWISRGLPCQNEFKLYTL